MNINLSPKRNKRSMKAQHQWRLKMRHNLKNKTLIRPWIQRLLTRYENPRFSRARSMSRWLLAETLEKVIFISFLRRHTSFISLTSHTAFVLRSFAIFFLFVCNEWWQLSKLDRFIKQKKKFIVWQNIPRFFEWTKVRM